jgi:hypothetical protein
MLGLELNWRYSVLPTGELEVKEKIAAILGIMFGAAIIGFTVLKIVPVEVFCSIAGIAVGWFFKTAEELLRRRIK